MNYTSELISIIGNYTPTKTINDIGVKQPLSKLSLNSIDIVDIMLRIEKLSGTIINDEIVDTLVEKNIPEINTWVCEQVEQHISRI